MVLPVQQSREEYIHHPLNVTFSTFVMVLTMHQRKKNVPNTPISFQDIICVLLQTRSHAKIQPSAQGKMMATIQTKIIAMVTTDVTMGVLTLRIVIRDTDLMAKHVLPQFLMYAQMREYN